MESAERIGIVLAGHVQAQKTFPNGSQVNVSVRGPGELIGPAAVFSASRKYPCDVVAIDSATVMMFRRVDLKCPIQTWSPIYTLLAKFIRFFVWFS